MCCIGTCTLPSMRCGIYEKNKVGGINNKIWLMTFIQSSILQFYCIYFGPSPLSYFNEAPTPMSIYSHIKYLWVSPLLTNPKYLVLFWLMLFYKLSRSRSRRVNLCHYIFFISSLGEVSLSCHFCILFVASSLFQLPSPTKP